MARQWSARCYGVARHREGSRQNSIGGSGVLSLRHFGRDPFIPWQRGCRRIWRGVILVYWFRRGRGCRPHDAEVAGGAVADLGLLISGPRLTLTLKHTPARGRGWPGRGLPVATGSLATERGRAKTASGSGALSLRPFGRDPFIPWQRGCRRIWRGVI